MKKWNKMHVIIVVIQLLCTSLIMGNTCYAMGLREFWAEVRRVIQPVLGDEYEKIYIDGKDFYTVYNEWREQYSNDYAEYVVEKEKQYNYWENLAKEAIEQERNHRAPFVIKKPSGYSFGYDPSINTSYHYDDGQYVHKYILYITDMYICSHPTEEEVKAHIYWIQEREKRETKCCSFFEGYRGYSRLLETYSVNINGSNGGDILDEMKVSQDERKTYLMPEFYDKKIREIKKLVDTYRTCLLEKEEENRKMQIAKEEENRKMQIAKEEENRKIIAEKTKEWEPYLKNIELEKCSGKRSVNGKNVLCAKANDCKLIVDFFYNKLAVCCVCGHSLNKHKITFKKGVDQIKMKEWLDANSMDALFKGTYLYTKKAY